MEPSKFDELTKALASATSRRQALKAITVTIFGSIAGLGGIGTAFAKCKSEGMHCENRDDVCCHGLVCHNGKCVPHHRTTTTTTTHAPTTTTTTTHAPTTTTTTTTSAPTTTTLPPCQPGCTVLSNGTCARMCSTSTDCTCGSNFCGSHLSGGVLSGAVCTVLGNSKGSCLSDSDCPIGYYCNGSGNCDQACC